MRRKSLSRGKDRKVFRKTASKPGNTVTSVMRGGIRK